MPNAKQGPQGQRATTGGATSARPSQGVGDQVRQMGQQLQEGAQHLGDRAREGLDTAREGVMHGYRQAEGMVARHPGQSVLMSFGVGFGLGVLLTVLLTQREESWYERHLPDSLRHLPDRLRHLHLPDALSRHLP